MRAFASILLILVISALATGVPQAIHRRQHELEDAREAAEAAAALSHDGLPAPALPHHHDDCPICIQFQAPLFLSTNAIRLIDTGTWVRHVSMPAVNQQSQTFPARISCRGPPSFSGPSAA